MKTTYLFFFLFVFGLTSCGPNLAPFTQRLIDENGWSDRELERIQFYLSEDVVLRRKFSSGDTRIESGEIKMIGNEKYEEILIARATPGVLIFKPKEERFAISFEKGDDKFLIFGMEPKMGGRYTLRAKNWNRKTGAVTYGNKQFFTLAENADASLMVDLKKINNRKIKSRRAEGRRIDD
jgi:hypothetical protein